MRKLRLTQADVDDPRRFVVPGAAPTAAEGEAGIVAAVVEWPDMENLQTWDDSTEYAPARPHRRDRHAPPADLPARDRPDGSGVEPETTASGKRPLPDASELAEQVGMPVRIVVSEPPVPA